jgi:hypothetical protein
LVSRLVDPLTTSPFEELAVEALKALAVIEMAQMRELMTQGVDEARVLERLTRRRMAQPNPDRPIGEADPVASLDIGSLGLQNAVAQPEARTDTLRVILETGHQLPSRLAIHPPTPPAGSFVIQLLDVNARRQKVQFPSAGAPEDNGLLS